MDSQINQQIAYGLYNSSCSLPEARLDGNQKEHQNKHDPFQNEPSNQRQEAINQNEQDTKMDQKPIHKTRISQGVVLNTEWSPLEEKFLMEQYMEKGPKWTYIAQKMYRECQYDGKRSQNDVKNKFYGTLRKFLRKINQIGRSQIPRFSKEVKYESIMRILQCREKTQGLPEVLMKQAMEIREKIIRLMETDPKDLSLEFVLQILQGANKFNLSSRCYKFKKISSKKQKQISEKITSISSDHQFSPRKVILKEQEKNETPDSFSLQQKNFPFGRTQENFIDPNPEDFKIDYEYSDASLELPIMSIAPPTLGEIYNFEKEVHEILGESYMEPERIFY